MIVFAIIALIIANAAGTFGGLLICCYAGMDFGFEDLRKDVAKCFALATIIVLVAYGLICLSPIPHVLLPIPVVLLFFMKLFWLELQAGEIIIAGFTSLLLTSFMASFLLCWF